MSELALAPQPLAETWLRPELKVVPGLTQGLVELDSHEQPDLQVLSDGNTSGPWEPDFSKHSHLELVVDNKFVEGTEVVADDEAIDHRCLTEADNLMAAMNSWGEISQAVLDDTHTNLVAAAKEGAMPYAVNRIRHERRGTGEHDEAGREIQSLFWLGQTAVQSAMSGRRFYHHEVGFKRNDIEIQEAKNSEQHTQAGYFRIFNSPRNTIADAPLEHGKEEHFADDDSIRLTWGVEDERGELVARDMDSVLIRDIPLYAYVDMLADPNNIFGKAIHVENPESAISVMKVHGEQEVPMEALPEGMLSYLKILTSFIKEPDLKESVDYQIKRMSRDQEEMHEEAVSVADRWLEFELELAKSLKLAEQEQPATAEVGRFIDSLMPKWKAEDRALIEAARIEGSNQFVLGRDLAAVLEKAKQYLLLVPAAVVTKNDKIIEQLSKSEVETIHRNEMKVRALVARDDYDITDLHRMEAASNNYVAEKKVKGGGGCIGDVESFGDDGYSIENKFMTEAEKKAAKEEQDRDDTDQFGSLTFRCDNGHHNRRERGKFIDKCQHSGCSAVVAC